MDEMNSDLLSPTTNRAPRIVTTRSALVTRRWAAAAFGCLLTIAVFALTYWFFIQTTSGQLADEAAFKGAQQYLGDGTRFSDPLQSFLGFLPQTAAILGAVALIIAGFVRRSATAPLIAGATWALASYSTQVLKHSILERPSLGVTSLANNSFPSGHTTFGTAAMVAILLVVAPRWRPLVALLGGGVSLVTGVSTVALGWHRPSDVIGAYLVCAFWGFIGGALVLVTGKSWNMRRMGDSSTRLVHVGELPLWPALMWFTAGLLGLAAPVIYFLATQPTAASELLAMNSWMFVAGIFLMSATALYVFATLNSFLSYLRTRESFLDDADQQPVWTSPVVTAPQAEKTGRAASSYEL